VDLTEITATNLNHLADLYLMRNAVDDAERVLQESIDLSRLRFPLLLAADQWILSGIQKGKHV